MCKLALHERIFLFASAFCASAFQFIGEFMQRRNVVLGLCVAAATLATPLTSSIAHAEDAYPSKPIRLIVPFPPGGTTDIVGRLFADKLGKELNQTVVVENRGGAGGSIGSAFVASSAPDGYTLGIATVSTHGINPAIYPNLPFDGEKDFTPVSNLAAVPNIMTINPKVQAKDMAEFIKLAKSQPGKLTYASAGNGSVSHMMGELFKMASGTDLMHVPYRGVGPALNDALAGQVDVMYDNLPSTLPHVQSGRQQPRSVCQADLDRDRQEQAHRQRSQREDRLSDLRPPPRPRGARGPPIHERTTPICESPNPCPTGSTFRSNIRIRRRRPLSCWTPRTAAPPIRPTSRPPWISAHCAPPRTPGLTICGATPSTWACP